MKAPVRPASKLWKQLPGTSCTQWIFTFLFLLRTTWAIAQVGVPHNEIGIRSFYGAYAQMLPEQYRYRPTVIAPYFNHYLTRSAHRSKLSIYIEPQITLVQLDYASDLQTKDRHSMELGFNAGIIYHYRVGRFLLYTGIGSGPNYISVHTRRQAHGFLFSDNLYLGIKEKMGKSYYLDLHLRARHISNAGLQSPNSGINNFFIGIGASRLL